MNVTIENARPEDATELCKNLRAFERAIEEIRGLPIVTERNVEEATWAKTVFVDGVPYGIVGVQLDGMLTRRGHLWLAVAAGAVSYPTSFGRYSVKLLQEIRSRFDALHGVVCHDFPESVRWLRWLNFTIFPPYPDNGLTISQFYWSR